MPRKAVCVGINYIDTEFELAGCINDADDWAQLLAVNGVDSSVLAEKQATRATILSSLKRLVKQAKAGDVVYFTYSGHGTWLPDRSGDETDRRDEALCPIDMDDGAGLILDDELHDIFTTLKPDARLVLITDCCHSGTMFRAVPGHAADGRTKPRFIPSSKFKTLPKAAAVKRSNAALPGVVHFSACTDKEVAADAEIGGRPCGAFSYYATRAFGARGATYESAFTRIRNNLPGRGYTQTPQFAARATAKNAKVFG